MRFLKVNNRSTLLELKIPFIGKQLKIKLEQSFPDFDAFLDFRNNMDFLRIWITHFMLLQVLLIHIYESIKCFFEFLSVLIRFMKNVNEYGFESD